jgi:arsenate reductase-like glutaredoxin family protein
MDPYISALVGLLGVLIGSVTSFGTTWLTQTSQSRDKHREDQVAKRQDLFVKFINEATRLYADALSHQKDDVSDLVLLYAMVAQMRLLCTRPVIEAADDVMTTIIETYLAPNRTLHEIRDLVSSGAMNFLTDFGEASRVELAKAS